MNRFAALTILAVLALTSGVALAQSLTFGVVAKSVDDGNFVDT